MYKISCIYLKLAVVVLAAFTVFHPERHAKHYPSLTKREILVELTRNNDDRYPNLKDCVYKTVINNNKEISLTDIFKSHTYNTPRNGGEYIPSLCRPLFKSAIIVPYRNREEQLNIFLNYMHSFMQNQNIHYRIFIVDQRDSMPFNRAKMLNIGATEAINAGFPCLILHDVDLIPLVNGNIYACTHKPRHMSSCLDTFRYNIPYVELFGGAVAIQSEQYIAVNGMSNEYDGWGGEDDDLFRRLKTNNMTICRFAQDISKYTMLKHKKAVPSANRYNLLNTGLQRYKHDGLNSLSLQYSVVEKPLYTHVIVS